MPWAPEATWWRRRLRDTLAANGYQVDSREWHDGPDLQVLADRLRLALEAWFPPD